MLLNLITYVDMAAFFQAESLTGIGNPILAGQQLLRQGVRAKWVIVKMGAKGSILVTKSSVSCAAAFKVCTFSQVLHQYTNFLGKKN